MLEKIDALKPSWLSSWILIGITLIIGYYKYVTWNFGIFKRLGIKGPKPIPVLGNLLGMQSIGLLKYDLELKKKYGPIIGFFMGKRPAMIIHDIQILKQILIKDFHLFTNRVDVGFFVPPLDKMILLLKDDHWKHVRGILTPTFSSGKMRKVSSHLGQCCDTLCVNLSHKADSGEVFDFRELCGTYTMDVIASTAFGIQIDSHNDPKNEFVTNASKMFKFKLNGPTLLFMFSPMLYHFFEKFGFSIFEKSITNFFFNVVDRAAKERQLGLTKNVSNDVKKMCVLICKFHGDSRLVDKLSCNSDNVTNAIDHVDFLHIMVSAHKENKESETQTEKNFGTVNVSRGLTNDELLARGFIFFLAGFETTANTLSLFGYIMALYPEIQERLYDEIIAKLGEETEPTYDFIKDMEYLEMCFSETLRMYPASPRTDRVASRDVTINGLFIPKGMTVIIPIYAIQNDPEYWDEPEVFNPERFAPSVRSEIEPLRYMPFGTGPRNCVGMRLAILELKMAIVKMMRKFKFIACSETQVPLKFEPVTMRAKNGIKIQVEKRK